MSQRLPDRLALPLYDPEVFGLLAGIERRKLFPDGKTETQLDGRALLAEYPVVPDVALAEHGYGFTERHERIHIDVYIIGDYELGLCLVAL